MKLSKQMAITANGFWIMPLNFAKWQHPAMWHGARFAVTGTTY